MHYHTVHLAVSECARSITRAYYDWLCVPETKRLDGNAGNSIIIHRSDSNGIKIVLSSLVPIAFVASRSLLIAATCRPSISKCRAKTQFFTNKTPTEGVRFLKKPCVHRNERVFSAYHKDSERNKRKVEYSKKITIIANACWAIRNFLWSDFDSNGIRSCRKVSTIFIKTHGRHERKGLAKSLQMNNHVNIEFLFCL